MIPMPLPTLIAFPELTALEHGPTLVAKVTLLLAAATIGAALMRYRSAAARHFVWAVTLSGALALTIIAPAAPRLALVITREQPADAPVARAGAVTSHPRGTASVVAGTRRGEGDAAPEARVSAAAREPQWVHLLDLLPSSETFVAVWLLGCLTLLGWCALGHLGLWRIARDAAPVDGPNWREVIDEARRVSGVTQPVTIARHAAVGGPVSWGWPKAVILLPLDAESWPVERRRVALVHELAHVGRRDYLTQLVGTLVCAIYWFHPLAWLATRRLRAESEHACDDSVLAAGALAPDYAAQLLAVARDSRTLRLTGLVVVSMARTSQLEGRLLAVLDDRRPRRAPSNRARAAVGAIVALALVPFAGVRPELRAASVVDSGGALATSSPATANAASTSPTAEEPVPAHPRWSRDTQEPRVDSTFERVVAASPGERLELDLETGATLDIRGWDEPRVRVRGRLDGPDWPDTRISVERVEGGVRVTMTHDRSRRSYSSSHSLEIRVPRRFDVRLNSAGGDLTMMDVEGTLRGHTGGGAMILERVTGRANLSTGGGDIRVYDSDVGGSVSTGGGMVQLSRVRGGLKGSSGSGPVIYAEREEARGAGARAEGGAGVGRGRATAQGRAAATSDLGAVSVSGPRVRVDRERAAGIGVLRIEKAGGAVDLDDAPEGARISTGGGKIRVRRGAGTVEAKTGGGDIEIGPIAGSVHAGTGAGDVQVTIVRANGEEQEVDVYSGLGEIIVELPPSFEGEVDLETAFTENHRRPTRIESPWELERETTSQWDPREGTPRRYVRARGTIGSGRGLVRIRTVNGDITLRRGR